MAAAVTAAGGFTATVSERYGYISATVPTGRVDAIAKSTSVVAVDLSESIPLPEPQDLGAGGAAGTTVAGPGADTPDDNPYMPTRDIGSVAFKTAHSAWDGRGITIGVIDSGVDLDHPALRETTTGERKIVDWVTGTHPLLESDGSWRPMLTSVTGPTFPVAGAGTWTAPSTGTYKFNRVSESIAAADEAAGDFNRDGDSTDRWGILYDEASHDIWVDVNQDQTFSPAERMRPYKEKFDVGHFGVDDPATAVAESMPFVVEYREDVDLTPAGLPGQKADYVSIGVVQAAHGSHVAGIAAGNGLFGGAVDGQAPGAKIVSSRACSWGGGCTTVALTDGMVDLVKNRGVDVVNMSIGGLPALNDANNARARLYDSLIADGVQLVISAGNSGPGINTIGDPSVATNVVSVGSSITKETWLANYGSEVSTPLTLHNYSSRGPREDGGFKPNVMAPGSAISTIPTWQAGSPVAEAGYSLPPGYAMFNGTSMAAPQTAGGVALLLSAAKASGITVTTRQLRDSLYTSADFVQGVEAIAQGAGQVDIPATWALLSTRPVSRDYTVSAPVCTPISDFLATADTGTGVYNRCDAANGGQASGEGKVYEVRATRTTGIAGRVSHNLRLVGNDGTFSLPTASRPMPKGEAVDIPVKARTSTPGVHSAILEIDDPATAVVDLRVLLTVVLSDGPPRRRRSPPAPPARSSGTSPRASSSPCPPVPRRSRSTSRASPVRTRSAGSPSTPMASPWSRPHRWSATRTSARPAATAPPVPTQPASGHLGDRGGGAPHIAEPGQPVPAERGGTGRHGRPGRADPREVQAGQPANVSWNVTNAFGAASMSAKGGNLGSAVSERKSIANGELAEVHRGRPRGR